MASCYGDGCCRVWDARTWRLLGRLKGAHASPCYGAAKTDGCSLWCVTWVEINQ